MDAQGAFATSSAIIARLAQGVPRGEPVSLLALAFAVILVTRFILARWAWNAVWSLTLIGLFGYYAYLATNLLSLRLGHDAALFAQGFAAALAAVFVVLAAKHWVHIHGERRPSGQSFRAPRAAAFSLGGAGMHGATRMVRRDDALPSWARDDEPTRASPSRGGEPEQGSALRSVMNVFDPSKQQNLFTVLSFMFIAEFGVFASVSIAAPRWQVGLGMFLLFIAGAATYIVTSYANWHRGLAHFAVGLVAAVAVSLLLGVFWSNESLAGLLSLHYFTSGSMVAAVTGVAFSLIIQGRG